MCFRCVIAGLNKLPPQIISELAAAGVTITGLDNSPKMSTKSAEDPAAQYAEKAKQETQRAERFFADGVVSVKGLRGVASARFDGSTVDIEGLGSIPVMVVGANQTMAEALQEAKDVASAEAALDGQDTAASAPAPGLAAGAAPGVDAEVDPIIGVPVHTARILGSVGTHDVVKVEDMLGAVQGAWAKGFEAAGTAQVIDGNDEYTEQLEQQSGEMRDMLLLALGGLIGGNGYQNTMGLTLLAELKTMEDQAE